MGDQWRMRKFLKDEKTPYRGILEDEEFSKIYDELHGEEDEYEDE